MEKLLKLLSIPSETGNCAGIYNFLLEEGNENGWDLTVDPTGNLYAVKGQVKAYPCVVAHMDTVHDIKKGGICPVIVNNCITGINPETMEQTGIGGDDKCGVWAALHCLKTLPACKAVFFVDEEHGCKGSANCWLPFFKDCRYILQADRRGNSDFVNTICGDISSKAFQEAVTPILIEFKYSFSWGAMTDVMALRDNEVGISAANISAGYYNPHCKDEYISITDLENVCAMMLQICTRITETFPFVYTEPKHTYCLPSTHLPSKNGNGASGVAAYSSLGDYYAKYRDHEEMDLCDMCQEIVPSNTTVRDPGGNGKLICIDCALILEQEENSPGGKRWWKRMKRKHGKHAIYTAK